MPRAVPPLSAALTYLRIARGWGRQDLALAAGLIPQTIRVYERDARPLSFQKLVELAAHMGYGPDEVNVAVLCHSFLSGAAAGEDAPASSPLAPSRAEVARARAIAARIALAEAVHRQSQMLELARARRIKRARQEASRQWEVLRRKPPGAQQKTIESSPRLQSWALAEHLCDESEKAAANDPPDALRMARLALRVAEIAPVGDAWRSRLVGYAWAFVGNAQRVSSDYLAADASLTTAWKLWTSCGPAPGAAPFGDWRLHDLEASLRRDQRRFAEALACVERALASAPASARPRILLKKQYVLEQAGEIEAALAVLDEAASDLQAAPEPRLRFGFEFNSIGMLCHLGRYSEAEARLPGLEHLTAELDNKMDTARVRWLSGRIAAGLGRRDEARAAFEKVQAIFSVHRIGIDAALVSLELAILYLEEGRTSRVVALAEDMLVVFDAQRIHREALAALRLFCDAVTRGLATVDLARRVRDYLQRARRNPRLRFAAP